MANESARRKKKMPGRGEAVAKAKTGSALKRHGKVGKSAARKQAKKAAKHVADEGVGPRVVYAADHGLMTAFHHMQRASVVMSLMEKDTGKDLRGLLKRE